MPWISACDLPDESVETMSASCIRPKHERTLARDHLNPVFLAELDCPRADRSFSSRPIHPNSTYPCLGAIAHHRIGHFRGGHQKGRVDWRLDVLYATEAAPSLNLGRAGIHGNNVIAAPTHFFKQSDAEALGLAGEPNHRNPFLRQEHLDRLQRYILSGHFSSCRPVPV